MRYPSGSQVPLPLIVRDATGAPVDPATLSITVYNPDGTLATTLTYPATVTRTSTGNYVGYFTVGATPGRYTWTGITTGPVTASQPDSFHAVAVTDAPLVSLADIRTHLGAGATANDLQLYDFAARATDACEQRTNRAWRRKTITEVHNGGSTVLLLRKQPIASVTTVVENGTTLTPGTDYTLDALSGELYRGGPLTRLRWWPGIQVINVIYVVAPKDDIVPDDITGGVLEMVRHLLTSQRGGSGLPRQDTSGDDWAPGAADSVPRWVQQLWAPYAMPPVSGAR